MGFVTDNLDLILLIVLGGAIVLITRVLLIRGIETLGAHMTPKTKGQVLGYATSTPELVNTVSTAARGLLGAGLWNVASSNIINAVLFASAMIYYQRSGSIFRRQFFDEIGFALGAIAIPLALATNQSWAQSPWAALALFGYLILYGVVDYFMNPAPIPEPGAEARKVPASNRALGVLLVLGGILGIVIAGHFLGVVAAGTVKRLGIPEVAVGWILGVISSLPELTTFFAIYAQGRRSGHADDSDTQQNLDNLAASNMSNLGFIYPLGIVVFLVIAV